MHEHANTHAVQAPVSTGTPVTQIGDGQVSLELSLLPLHWLIIDKIQAPVNSTASPTVVAYTGAAALPTMRSELFGLAAGVLAVAML